MRSSGTFKGRHRSGAARAEAPLRQMATPRNWLRGRCVEQPVLSNKEIPLSVPEARPGQVPEARPGQVPEARPGQVPEARPGQVPEARPGQVPEARPGQVPEARPGQQMATPRNWLRGRCVEQPVLSNKEIPLSVPEARPGQVPEARPGQVPEARPGQVPEARTVCPLGVREAHSGKKLVHASSEPGAPGRGR